MYPPDSYVVRLLVLSYLDILFGLVNLYWVLILRDSLRFTDKCTVWFLALFDLERLSSFLNLR